MTRLEKHQASRVRRMFDLLQPANQGRFQIANECITNRSASLKALIPVGWHRGMVALPDGAICFLPCRYCNSEKHRCDGRRTRCAEACCDQCDHHVGPHWYYQGVRYPKAGVHTQAQRFSVGGDVTLGDEAYDYDCSHYDYPRSGEDT